MVKCPDCGAELREGDKFCYSCGADATKQKEADITTKRRHREEREACFGPPWSGRGLWGAISAGVFLVGLGLLWYFDFFWPGILILIGLMMVIGGIAAYTRR